jgi:uncharacterized protein
MHINLDSAVGNSIQSYSAAGVVVDGRLIRSSVIISANHLEQWTPTTVGELDANHMAQLTAHQPDIVILGTGNQQRFPAPALLVELQRHGIGVEVMANDAAVRTYDVLLSEQRNVLLALLQE